jgi:acetylglutamate kinase
VLNRLLDAGFVPVVSPLSADDDGNVLNINADTVAATIARELGAEKLVFLSDSNGILEDRNDPSSSFPTPTCAV